MNKDLKNYIISLDFIEIDKLIKSRNNSRKSGDIFGNGKNNNFDELDILLQKMLRKKKIENINENTKK